MRGRFRYARLLWALGRYALARELAFRGNFLVKVSVEALWLAILLIFYRTVFARTNLIAGWTEDSYLFFVGCFFALNGLVETLFLANCDEFSELVRTGDLDFLLLRPIDEQFLISCRKIDWSSAPSVVMGGLVMLRALLHMGWHFDPVRLGLFVLLFACGTAIAYGFMLMLTSLSVWLVRNQGLMEMWWLFSSLARYPREVFRSASWADPIAFVFTFMVPILLVASVPSEVMVRALDWRMVALMVAATLIVLTVSRRFFRHALRSYRSASS